MLNLLPTEVADTFRFGVLPHDKSPFIFGIYFSRTNSGSLRRFTGDTRLRRMLNHQMNRLGVAVIGMGMFSLALRDSPTLTWLSISAFLQVRWGMRIAFPREGCGTTIQYCSVHCFSSRAHVFNRRILSLMLSTCILGTSRSYDTLYTWENPCVLFSPSGRSHVPYRARLSFIPAIA